MLYVHSGMLFRYCEYQLNMSIAITEKNGTNLFPSLLQFYIHSQNKSLQTRFCSFCFKILPSMFFFSLFRIYMSHCSLSEMIYNKNLTALVFLEPFLL